ncbi:MAG: hypothetical protein WBH31_13820 [Promethearchaeia archaeon]
MNYHISLSYFDTKIGPVIFYSYPKQGTDEEIAGQIVNIMDQNILESFFTFNFNSIYLLNYKFEIKSPWSRGKCIPLMISAVFFQRPSIETEKTILSLSIEFSEWLKSKDDVFTAFCKNTAKYSESNDTREMIDKNIELIQLWIKELYGAISDEIQESVEKEIIIDLLNKKNAIKTLKYLLDNPISLLQLKDWYSHNFPNQNFYSLIIKLMKYQMIYIPDFGKYKKAPFRIHVSDKIKAIINLTLFKNRLLNSYIEELQESASKPQESQARDLKELLDNTLINE